MNMCHIIAARRDSMPGLRLPEGYLPSCVMPDRHENLGYPHVFKTPDGQYYSWEDDTDCGCCEPDEDSRCFSYEEITEEQYRTMFTAVIHPSLF
jgi:hypothetical protein